MKAPVDARRAMLHMIALVVLLDVAAIALYHFTSLGHSRGNARIAFVVVWTLLTLAIVLTGLRRIRAARGR